MAALGCAFGIYGRRASESTAALDPLQQVRLTLGCSNGNGTVPAHRRIGHMTRTVSGIPISTMLLSARAPIASSEIHSRKSPRLWISEEAQKKVKHIEVKAA